MGTPFRLKVGQQVCVIGSRGEERFCGIVSGRHKHHVVGAFYMNHYEIKKIDGSTETVPEYVLKTVHGRKRRYAKRKRAW